MMIIQSDLSKIAPTLLTHNCWQSTSLIAQQIQASTALSTIVISRDRITIAPIIIHHSTDPSYAHLSTVNFSGRSAYPGICGTFNDCHFQRSHYYSTENSSARSVTAIFCGGSAPSIHSIKRSCAYSSTVSFSGRPAAPKISGTFNMCHFKTSNCHRADHSCTHLSTAVSFCGPALSIINHDCQFNK